MVSVRISYCTSICVFDIAHVNLASVPCWSKSLPSLEIAVDYAEKKEGFPVSKTTCQDQKK